MKTFRILCFAAIVLSMIVAVQSRAAARLSSGPTTVSALVDTPRFSIPFVIYVNGLYSYGIDFGIHPSASKGIDPALGETEYPPFPPGGGLSMFVTAGGNAILDLRP